MKPAGFVTAVLVLAIGAINVGRAVPPGMTVEFDGQGEGKVTFVGRTHSGPGMHCSNCHMELFDVSRSSQILRADHRRRQFCFGCHDGAMAFAARGNCDRCHVEPLAEPAIASVPPPAP